MSIGIFIIFCQAHNRKHTELSILIRYMAIGDECTRRWIVLERQLTAVMMIGVEWKDLMEFMIQIGLLIGLVVQDKCRIGQVDLWHGSKLCCC